MSDRFDLAVIGAGPAGAAAAMAAQAAGLSVVLFDEGRMAGGQVYRPPTTAPGRAASAGSRERAEGERLRERLSASGVELRPGRRVWSVSGRFRIDAIGQDGPETVEADRLVAATGAHERITPFPGWTLPGVIGLAAATVLLKTEGRLPGRAVVVAGCGPLLAQVAAKVVRGGGRVAAIVDLASWGEWACALPALATGPALLAEGASWGATIARARVPVHSRHAVVDAGGDDRLARLAIAPVDADGRPDRARLRWIEADLLAVGHGLAAGSDVTRLLQAAHRVDPDRGGVTPVADEWGRTSVEGLYAAGDGAAVAGADPAALNGRLAGLAAAHDAGRLAHEPFAAESRAARAELARGRRFSAAVARLMRRRPGLVDAIPPDTVVCRCEDVTRSEIEAAVEAGARELNQLKHFTRCGMGPCQGRMCGETAGDLMAARLGASREAVGWWTMRPPLRPVPLAALSGAFGYDDIPVPEPAPL